MENCIFCKIVAGEIPSSKVYEDDEVLAFMTINAINPGHALIIPKSHVNNAFDIEDELYIKIQMLVKKMAHATKKAFNPIRVGMMVSGMEVPHAHFHVVPINESNDVSSKKAIEGTSFKFDTQTLDEHAQKIKQNLEQ